MLVTYMFKLLSKYSWKYTRPNYIFYCVRIVEADTVLLLWNVNALFFLCSLFSSIEICVHCSSVEMSTINLKHLAQYADGLNLRSNIFFRKYDMRQTIELFKISAWHPSLVDMDPPRSKCYDSKSISLRQTWDDAAVNGQHTVYNTDTVSSRKKLWSLVLFYTLHCVLRVI